jgi:hypothetical protein
MLAVARRQQHAAGAGPMEPEAEAELLSELEDQDQDQDQVAEEEVRSDIEQGNEALLDSLTPTQRRAGTLPIASSGRYPWEED